MLNQSTVHKTFKSKSSYRKYQKVSLEDKQTNICGIKNNLISVNTMITSVSMAFIFSFSWWGCFLDILRGLKVHKQWTQPVWLNSSIWGLEEVEKIWTFGIGDNQGQSGDVLGEIDKCGSFTWINHPLPFPICAPFTAPQNFICF